jgi:hypothetical protein
MLLSIESDSVWKDRFDLVDDLGRISDVPADPSWLRPRVGPGIGEPQSAVRPEAEVVRLAKGPASVLAVTCSTEALTGSRA